MTAMRFVPTRYLTPEHLLRVSVVVAIVTIAGKPSGTVRFALK